MIYKVESFIDDDGRQVLKKVMMNGEIVKNLDGSSQYIGETYIGTFSLTVPTPYGPQEDQINFNFPNYYTLERSFNEFDKFAEEEYERLMKEVKEKSLESKIITPDGKGGIVMP